MMMLPQFPNPVPGAGNFKASPPWQLLESAEVLF
jgi:hypothetical protein